MKISKEDLEKLKIDSENHFVERTFLTVDSRSSAYLAIETIRQLRSTVWYNTMYIVLGTLLGFIGSICTTAISEDSTKKELKELRIQLKKVQMQLTDYQMYHSKKDSLQTFSKKN